MKFMTIDDQILIFGSANLDKISLRHCHETNIVIDHRRLTMKAITTLFKPAWETSILIDNNLHKKVINSNGL
ncbi:phospholipase D-like domain-containing protein [Legionella sp. CNM-1927-20]|uniref:phospholipase D-like domain-containing protein n=1 Tax=Legionella sp. CNM-1927-20 TaxID=3422221 RepID=UPI00403AF27D